MHLHLPSFTKSKSVIIPAVLSIVALSWKAVNALSNVEFLLQKLGLSESAAKFLSSPRGIDFITAITLIALVVALVFQANKIATGHLQNDPKEKPSAPRLEILFEKRPPYIFECADSTKVYRIGIKNTGSAPAEGIKARLNFTSLLQTYSDVPLRLKDSQPPHPLEFSLAEGEEQLVDVAHTGKGDEWFNLCHVNDEQTVPKRMGTMPDEFSIVVSGKGIEPRVATLITGGDSRGKLLFDLRR